MFEKIRDMIVEELGVEESQITENVSFKDDLGTDSLDLFELVMKIEDEFGVKISTQDLENINTVGDVLKYIEEHK